MLASASRGGSGPRGLSAPGGGGSGPGGCRSGPGGYGIPACTEADTLPPCGQNHRRL